VLAKRFVFNKTNLVCCIASAAAAALTSTAFADEGYQFSGIWRAGFNTASPFTGREFVDGTGGNSFYNFFERLTLEASDTQNSPRLKTSRHARDPNYLKLQFVKTFPSEAKVVFGIDTKSLAQETTTQKLSSSDDETSALPSLNSFRIRDLYTVLPTSGEWRVWAGSRQIEFEDLRLFDSGNPFDTKALGIGLESDKKFFSIGYSKTKREGVIDGAETPARNAGGDPQILVETKDATILYRVEMPLEANYTVIPMFKMIVHGAAQADSTTGGKRKAIRGSEEFFLGSVMARQDPESGNFGNSTLGVNLRPPDNSEESIRGDSSGFDATFFLQDSSVFNFPGWGVITGLAVEQTIFKNEQSVFRVQTDGSIVATGEKARNQRTISLGAQPVLYVTKAFHLALDVNYSFRDKKVQKNQSNAFLVTPIIRYAMNESVLGSPQLYSSFTYGRYDLDFKKQIDGSFKNTLSTVQSGIEVWF